MHEEKAQVLVQAKRHTWEALQGKEAKQGTKTATRAGPQSRNHEEWEKTYRKVCTTVRTPKEDECEGNSNGSEHYKSVLYCEM
jgi:hypothetical protein